MRDEERYLDGCLASVAPIVDEIVVVDTGSRDATREIARRHGATLAEFTWQDDFAAARNRAIELATSQWILYIDADERISHVDRPMLEAALADPRHAALWVLLNVHPGFTPYQELRLFRNDPGIRFRGVIHESIWPSVRRLMQGGSLIGESGVALEHLGYVGDQQHKIARNLPMLLRAVEHEPDRVYLWVEMAKAYEELGQLDRAASALTRALSIARARGDGDSNDAAAYIASIGFRFRHDAAAGDFDDLVAASLAAFPSNRQLLWFAACRLIDLERFAEALDLLPRVLAPRTPRDLDMTFGYDRRIVGEFAFEACAMCHFKLGHFAEAARWFELALGTQPANEPLRRRLDEARRLAGRESGE